MTLTISVFWVVLLIVIVHTGLQHLINWGWRAVYRYEDDGYSGGFLILLMIMGTLLEVVLLLYVLENVLKMKLL